MICLICQNCSRAQWNFKSRFSAYRQFQNYFCEIAKLKEQDGYNIYLDKCKERVFVKADELKISQVIYNLVNNAINYAGEDKTVVVTQQVIGDKVRINVTDHARVSLPTNSSTFGTDIIRLTRSTSAV